MLYNTSNLRKIITKVRVSWQNDDLYIAKIGLYRLDPDDGNRILEVLYFGGFATDNPGFDGEIFSFSDAPDGRIVIPAGIRLGIALSRNDNHAHSLDIQHGFENANSPDESYSDANVDFDFIGNTRLASVEPDTDDSLSPHNNEVWGNIKIFYTVAVSHASLIGDDNVNIDHISSGSATDGQVITADGAGGSDWEDSGGGVSLSDDDPISVSISLNDEGTGTGASRQDHRHRVDQANTGQYGVVRYATDAEALLGTSSSRTIAPSSLDHVLGEFLSDDDPEDVGTAAEGTGTEASRSDHVHAGAAASGTNVVANPTGTDGDDLTRVSIAGTNYVIPEGGGGTEEILNCS